jgi:hypothetical protein
MQPDGHTRIYTTLTDATYRSDGKAAAEITALHMWTIQHVNTSTTAHEGVSR